MSAPTLGGLPIAVGDVLLRKYRVDGLIGEGGAGIVLAATHVQLEQRLAIKFLRRALETNELRTRFEREARAIGKIESDHVVLVIDAGALDDGSPYMVMEHLDGRDLARVLKEDGQLPIEQAVDCMLQVCEALRQAHAAGIVHRDLKPANLFLTRRDGDVHIKVVDFGISKILDRTLTNDGKPHDVTSDYDVLGSPRYMAPEQLKSSRHVDLRADLWSVGAVLFQLITGRHAFEAENPVKATIAVLTSEPHKLCALMPNAPRELEAVVSRCLEKDVSKRFQTAEELGAALKPFASERMQRLLEWNEDVHTPVGVAASAISPGPSKGEGWHDDFATKTLVMRSRPAPAAPPTPLVVPVSPIVPIVQVSPAAPWTPAGPFAPAAPVPKPPHPPSSGSKLILTGLAVCALALVVGVVVVASVRPASLRSARASAPSAGVSSANVTLDAGRASP